MSRLNTIFLGIIAAVLVGAAVVWWLNQPSELEAAMEDLRESSERLREVNAPLRAVSD